MILPHFDNISKTLNLRGWEQNHQSLTISRDGLKGFLRLLASQTPFDEKFYLHTYPDVKEGVATGELTSAKEHYMEFGIFEGRLPSLDGFDCTKYLKTNKDLIDSFGKNAKKDTITQHFIENGHKEGRPF